ncbi:MAG: serine/threonine-protein kinase, partial [Myxococcales bacterium]
MEVRRIRDFEVERSIGTGGMAAVYLAQQVGSGRRVALKLMHPHLATDPVFVQRFLQEVKATTGLNHPNIVQVVACGEDAGRYYMASEFVDAGTVGDLLRAVHKLPAAIAADLTMQLLEGLGCAHERGIVHRDIKPANLMLTSDGVLKVGDFGIARTASSAALTQTGNLIGTPAYMSPEQAAGQPIDARSDLFAVGVVAYELLTGFNPYLGENESTTLLKILKSTPRIVFEADPTVPPALENILERLLERDPARRYGSAAEAVEELRPLVEAERQKHPGLVAEFIRDPVATKRRLNDAQAALYLWQASERLKLGPAERYQAA